MAEVTVRCKDKASGTMSYIKIPAGMPITEAFNKYCQQSGDDISKCNFVSGDNHQLHRGLKVNHLKGGTSENESVTVKAHCKSSGDIMYMRVVKGTPMNDIFDVYSQKRGIEREKISFVDPAQKEVNGMATPKSILDGVSCDQADPNPNAPSSNTSSEVVIGGGEVTIGGASPEEVVIVDNSVNQTQQVKVDKEEAVGGCTC